MNNDNWVIATQDKSYTTVFDFFLEKRKKELRIKKIKKIAFVVVIGLLTWATVFFVNFF